MIFDHHQPRPAALVVAGRSHGDGPEARTVALITSTLTGVPIYGGVCGVPRRAYGTPKASDLGPPTSNGFRLSCTSLTFSTSAGTKSGKAIARAVTL